MEMPLRIINVNIVTPDEVLYGSGLTVEDGAISRIGGRTSGGPPGRSPGGGCVIDAGGAFLLPGMIDIHSDQIEQAIEPRAGSVMDIGLAIREQEKQLVNHGITTMYHSLSMWRITDTASRRKIARETGFRDKIMREIISSDASPRLIKHKLHIRFDIVYIEGVGELMELLKNGGVSLLSFMDHTPGQGQYRDVERFAATIKAGNPALSDEEVNERMLTRMRTVKVPKEKLVEIARFAKRAGISIASHDDDSFEKIDYVKNMLGATISEFPVELDVARYAKKLGMTTLVGAPNVLTGKSHSGNMSAIDGILDGSVAAMCSDYYPPAMLEAVFKLHREYKMPLNECVNLVSLIPAKAAGIGAETGSIEEGKDADLLLVDASGKYPRLCTVITNGHVTSMLNYIGGVGGAAGGVVSGGIVGGGVSGGLGIVASGTAGRVL